MFFPILCNAQEKVVKPVSNSSSMPTRWAVKTNMAYNALSFINLGVESSIGKHWSMGAELIAPWWDAPDYHKTAQMINFGLDGRYYWQGWQDPANILSGPFVGIHANGGFYDICYKNSGAKGDYFVMSGAEIGYSLNIESWWRLNFTLGAGAMYTSYSHYHVREKTGFGRHLVSHYSGKYTYFGPTKVELSVVWLFSQCFQDK